MWYLNIAYRWLFIFAIVILAHYLVIRPILRVWARRIAIDADRLLLDTKYSEKDIIAHLDYIIMEVLDNYELLHIQPKSVYYINGKLEQEVLDHVSAEVSRRISKTLKTQLAFIYNEGFIGDFIGTRIYLMTVDYVLQHNLEHAEETEQNNAKLPMGPQTTDISDAL